MTAASTLDTERVRATFDASQDLTVGIEEEFAILDPETRSLTQRFEGLRRAARDDEVLARSAALAIAPRLPAQNGAQRQRRALERGDRLDEIYAAEVDDTGRTYAPHAPADAGVTRRAA